MTSWGAITIIFACKHKQISKELSAVHERTGLFHLATKIFKYFCHTAFIMLIAKFLLSHTVVHTVLSLMQSYPKTVAPFAIITNIDLYTYFLCHSRLQKIMLILV